MLCSTGYLPSSIPYPKAFTISTLYCHGSYSETLFVILKDATPVIASVGEDVALKCFDSNTPDLKSCHRGRWIKYDVNNRRVEVILAPHKTKKAQDAGRVKWTPGENGHMSLVLTKLQKSDEGLYGCEIWEGWDCLLVKNISLKVKGKTHQ